MNIFKLLKKSPVSARIGARHHRDQHLGCRAIPCPHPPYGENEMAG